MLSRASAKRPRVRLAYTVPAWLSGIAILIGALVYPWSAARAGNTSWYLAADVGQSRFTSIGTGNPIFPDSFSSTDNGYRLSAGYQINPYFAVEATYVHLGQVSGSYTELGAPPGGPTCGLPCDQSYIVNANLETRGWTFEFVGTYPFNNSWVMFARAGGIQAYSELNANYIPIPPYNFTFFQNTSITSKDLDVTYGLGVQWLFAGNWAVRLSWDRYSSIGHELPIGSFNVNLTSLGLVYQP